MKVVWFPSPNPQHGLLLWSSKLISISMLNISMRPNFLSRTIRKTGSADPISVTFFSLHSLQQTHNHWSRRQHHEQRNFCSAHPTTHATDRWYNSSGWQPWASERAVRASCLILTLRSNINRRKHRILWITICWGCTQSWRGQRVDP